MKTGKFMDIVTRALYSIICSEETSNLFSMKEKDNLSDCITTLWKSCPDNMIKGKYLSFIVKLTEDFVPLALGKLDAPGLSIEVDRNAAENSPISIIITRSTLAGIRIDIDPYTCNIVICKVLISVSNGISTVTSYFFNQGKIRMSIDYCDNDDIVKMMKFEDLEKIRLLDHINVLS